MNHINNDINKEWNDFINIWEESYNIVKSFLQLAEYYPDELKAQGFGELIKCKDLDASQKDWLFRCSSFGKDEKDYLKS